MITAEELLEISDFRYRGIKSLGAGGFAEVFEVVDESSGDSKALKVFNWERCGDRETKNKRISLFKREAEVLKQLRNPGIPKGEEYCEFHPNWSMKPWHCIIMEKIEGPTLQDWMGANQPISQARALDWLQQLVEVLDYLHQNGYFHRDIKPANIMLQPDGKLVIIDFGTVRKISDTYLAKIGSDRQLTRSVSSGYTPLEQFDGKAVPQSDFYALGHTFVYLLTGKECWELPKNERGKLLWRKQAPQISQQLADLIDRMSAPLPRDRPRNTKDILQRLSEIKSRAKPAARRINLALGSLILLGLINFPVASPLAVTLNKAGVKNHRAGKMAIAEFSYRAARLLKPDYGKLEYNLGSLYEEQGKPDMAMFHYEKAMQNGIAAAYNNQARLQILAGKCDRAISLLEQGLQQAKRNYNKYALFVNLGRAKQCQEGYPEAAINLQKALKIDDRNPVAHCLRAPVMDKLGDKQGALFHLQNCPSDPNNPPEFEAWLKDHTRQRLLETS
ncbi:MAG: protein kinase [Hormoscilla sp.]